MTAWAPFDEAAHIIRMNRYPQTGPERLDVAVGTVRMLRLRAARARAAAAGLVDDADAHLAAVYTASAASQDRTAAALHASLPAGHAQQARSLVEQDRAHHARQVDRTTYVDLTDPDEDDDYEPEPAPAVHPHVYAAQVAAELGISDVDVRAILRRHGSRNGPFLTADEIHHIHKEHFTDAR